MKKVVAVILVMVLTATVTLTAVIVLVGASISISQITSPALRAVAVAAALFAGIAWLLGAVYIATHLAVRIFRHEVSPPRA